MPDHFPKISIVTISYNQGAYLEECIASVLSQQYPNLEYIIIDAGSTDNSVDIIKKYEEHLAWWVSEPDQGMYNGIQKGFEKSTGTIMSWINSDDRLAENSLFNAVEILTNFPLIEWLGGISNTIDDAGKLTWVGNLPKWNKYRYLQLDFRYIQQEGTFWKRSLWEKAGSRISTEYSLAGDLELWSRFFQHSEFYFVTVFLGTFRRRQKNQKTLDKLKDYDQQALEILTKMPQTEEEKRILSLKNTSPSRFSSKRKKGEIKKAAAIINRFPLPLLFDEKKQQFILYDAPYS